LNETEDTGLDSISTCLETDSINFEGLQAQASAMEQSKILKRRPNMQQDHDAFSMVSENFMN
jgi:hypothetical protein